MEWGEFSSMVKFDRQNVSFNELQRTPACLVLFLGTDMSWAQLGCPRLARIEGGPQLPDEWWSLPVFWTTMIMPDKVTISFLSGIRTIQLSHIQLHEPFYQIYVLLTMRWIIQQGHKICPTFCWADRDEILSKVPIIFTEVWSDISATQCIICYDNLVNYLSIYW